MNHSSSARSIIGAAVRVGGLRVGRVIDVVMRPDLSTVLGCEVARPDGTRAFLPWIATTRCHDAVDAAGATVLLGELELRHYLGVGLRLTGLLGAEIECGDGMTGNLDDLVADPLGRVIRLVLSGSDAPYPFASCDVPMRDGLGVCQPHRMRDEIAAGGAA